VNLYSCAGFRSIRSDSIGFAAEVFALRSARRSFGRSARVGPVNAECWTRDGRVVEFSAFIGYPTGRNETTGHNVRFTVINGGSL
jgi:hypothetical protein